MEQNSAPKDRGSRFKLILLAVIAAVICIFALDGFITDLIWFRKEGYLSVYLKEITTKLKLGVPCFAAVTLLAELLLTLLRKGYTKKSGMSLQSSKAKNRVARLSWLLSAAFGLLLSVSVVGPLWFNILEFFNSTDFSVADPLFGNDVSFYIFKLNFLNNLSACAINIVVALAIMLALFYLILIGSAEKDETVSDEYYASREEAENAAKKKARRSQASEFMGPIMQVMFGIPFYGENGAKQEEEEEQSNNSYGNSRSSFDTSDLKTKLKALVNVAAGELTALGIVFFLLTAVRFYLKQFDLLYEGTGVCYGAGYTDMTVTLTVYRIIMVLSVVSAVMLAVGIKKKKLKLALIFPVMMIVCGIAGNAISLGVQSLIVAPDELNKESEYLANNISFTRLAYNLQDIQVKDFPGNGQLEKTEVLDNMETFSNIRINDFDPAKQFYNQTQSIRSYYNFGDVDVDRYYVNGEYTQCFLSAREIDQTKIEDSWLIKHLKYTHGYGITLSRVDKVTGSGQPDMLIDNIPPVSDVPEITVEKPEIYYGESTDSYVITNTGEKEFDYPSGESNVYCEYQGTGGIRLTPLNRLLFALREQSLKILISTNITSDSRIHIYRNIMEKAEKIAPFLTYNDDPYVVCVDGKLYWIIDAYTTSSLYPYSEPYSDADPARVNYIRNSVKAVVDAYNGDINYYICDETDPLVITLSKIYPDLLKSLDQMPEGLRQHIQYPNALFDLQAYVYTKYHMTDVAVFYQNEDLWSIASEQYGQETKQMEPNYFIMKLPGEDSAEFVSTLPYTPSSKSNLTGILMARQDGDNYGQLVLYRMPKDRTVYGPAQIEAQINQDAEISKEFSLWNNSGSSYLRGNMFVIPVEDTLLYVEPIYLEASTGSLPEVKRVVAYYGDKVAYESTLADCLNVLFGEGAGDPLLTAYPIVTGHQMADELRNQPAHEEKPAPQPGQLPEITQPEELAPAEGAKAESLEELAYLAQKAYDEALSAMQQGDWITYGQYMDLLSKYLMLMVKDPANEAHEEGASSFKITVEPQNEAISFTYAPKSARAGETVELKTEVRQDADIHVYLDGKELEKTHYDSDYWGYSFVMPEKDVTVSARFYTESELSGKN